MNNCKQNILWYGQSGVGKTHQAGRYAEWIYDKTGLPTRLVSTSGGQWQTIQPHVEAGIILPTYIPSRPFAYETTDRFSKGWWPADLNDDSSPLLPPEKQNDAAYGGIIFDGMSEMADWLMEYTVQAESRGEFRVSGMKEPAAAWTEGESTYGAPSMGMYGAIQNHVAYCVSLSRRLPGVYVAWTALEASGEDDRSKMPILGPDVIGSAKTNDVPAWFSHVLHLVVDDKDGMRKMFLENHPSRLGKPWLAKNTIPAKTPQYYSGDQCDVYYFMSELERLTTESRNIILNRLKKEKSS